MAIAKPRPLPTGPEGDHAIKLIETWNAANSALAVARANEKAAREALAGTLFPDPVEGSGNKIDIGYGSVLQLDHKINRRLDEAELDAIRVGIPEEVFSTIVNVKLSLSVTEWKRADDATKELFHGAVTEAPGAPSLKIVQPKK